MDHILIRSVDDAVLDVLRLRAAAAQTSLEEEARCALAASVGPSREAALARLDAVRVRVAAASGPSSLDDLHTDRARDR